MKYFLAFLFLFLVGCATHRLNVRDISQEGKDEAQVKKDSAACHLESDRVNARSRQENRIYRDCMHAKGYTFEKEQ